MAMATLLLGKTLDELIGPRGGNWAFFAKNAKQIGEFIQVNNLRPATIGNISAPGVQAERIMDLGIRGGIRVAHLHFENRIYLLDNKQWAKFSDSIIADCKSKLANAKAVTFDEGMLLGSLLGSEFKTG
jgi:hypothetical protein